MNGGTASDDVTGNHHFHSAILLAAIARIIVSHGPDIADTHHRNAAYRDVVLGGEVASHRGRAALAQLFVVFGRAGFIGEALDLDHVAIDTGRFLGDRVELFLAFLGQRVRVEV